MGSDIGFIDKIRGDIHKIIKHLKIKHNMSDNNFTYLFFKIQVKF